MSKLQIFINLTYLVLISLNYLFFIVFSYSGAEHYETLYNGLI